MKIERITVDDEPRRRFFLLAEVTFRDDPDGDVYYSDGELPDVTAEWIRAAIDDRDDSPRIRLLALPEVLDVDIQSVARGDYPGHEQVTY